MVAARSPTEVAELLRSRPQEVFLLDVREPYERDMALIEPSVHIPMNEVPSRQVELPADREIVVYCHGGTRSAMVAAYLERAGFQRMSNLTGGIDAWSLEVDPNVPRYG
ncbi:MAG: rhodanese-like domain-containing protein [Thermoplasmata archaeon]